MRTRLASAVVVIVIIGGIYWYSSTKTESASAFRAPTDEVWYSRAAEEFSKLTFASIEDSVSAEAAIQALVDKRCPGDDFGVNQLARDAARVIRALGAPSIEEYMSRNPLRRLDPDGRIDRQGYLWWERCFGTPPVASTSSAEAYSRLVGHVAPDRLPREIASLGRVQIRYGPSEAHRRAEYPRFRCPSPLVERIGNSNGGTGEPCLTAPTVTLAQAASKERVSFCTMSVILRGEDKKPFMISMLFYYVSWESSWHLAALADDSTWPPICLPF